MSKKVHFGYVIECLKMGNSVTRRAWANTGMYLYYLNDHIIAKQTKPRYSHDEHFRVMLSDADAGSVEQVMLEPCIVVFTREGKHQPGWTPLTEDILATDWEIL